MIIIQLNGVIDNGLFNNFFQQENHSYVFLFYSIFLIQKQALIKEQFIWIYICICVCVCKLYLRMIKYCGSNDLRKWRGD